MGIGIQPSELWRMDWAEVEMWLGQAERLRTGE